MDYSEEYIGEMKSALAKEVRGLAKAEPRAIERNINEAAVIRDQLGEAAKLADSILERVAGPRPECSGDENCKEAFAEGTLGELARVQASTLSILTELRRALGQIGKYV